jgi:AcrR family transcriptional regulator
MKEPNLIVIDQPQHTRADALKNRALILETASRLFNERGVSAVTMSDIVEEAAIGKGTLYRHFENKFDLCHSMLDHDQRALQERSLEYLREHDDALANLSWFLAEIAHFVDRNIELLCVGTDHGAVLDHPAHWWWRMTIRGLLGQINPPGDLDYISDMLYLMLDVRTIFFQRQQQGYSIERISDGLVDILHQLVS